MTRPADTAPAQPSAEAAGPARRVVETLGGRYSSELGINVNAGDAEIERWFLAATLFGTRITAQTAERTFRVLTSAGLVWVGQARHIPAGTFIAYLDEGGYGHYDAQTVARLQALSEIIGERYDGQAALIGHRHITYPALRAALDVLPGWGPVIIQLFLRDASRNGAGVAELLTGRSGRALCPVRRWPQVGTFDDGQPVLIPRFRPAS